MMTVKASAKAHPVQELIKYRGSSKDSIGMPIHDSISVCLSPPTTHSTIEFGDFENDNAKVNGHDVGGSELGRIVDLVDAVRFKAECASRFRIELQNDFPSQVLDSPSSCFAAIALAACKALDLDLEPKEVSKLARKGAPSSTQSVTGGFSRLKTGFIGEEPYSFQLASGILKMGIVVPLLPRTLPVDVPHGGQDTPRFPSSVGDAARLVDEMELATRKGDVGRVCMLAEEDTLLLHGISMTGVGEVFAWPSATLKIVHAVKTLREEGRPAFFSVDRGGRVYVNTLQDKVEEVERAVKDLGVEILRCSAGGEAKITEDHLF